ncbi:NusG domain II-containing protein [Sedimentibacter sp. B4]|uniref:NusG domain II-containing protein n=1 Tax=Sedimentibacter sp. B4 TaxID=304766 RepID=UPI0002E72C69|nr:NusG domain II-containing protein [Sedimentibacter sp. B4]
MLSKMTLWDKILICSLIIISLAWLGLAVLFNTKVETKVIEIKVYGNIVEKLLLTEEAADTYSFEYGENTGFIEVKDGAVRMLEMDKAICPEEICSKTGWIKEEYETIVCMPNGIIVNIKNNTNNQENDIDIDIVA